MIHELVTRLGLHPHPEGGFYREIYRAPLTLPQAALPASFAGDRAASTAIHFLLTADTFSALHKIAADELWFFLGGDPLDVFAFTPEGAAVQHHLGSVDSAGSPFCVIPAGQVFGARVAAPGRYSLVSCVVAPGFDFADFELCKRGALLETWPEHRELITSLTRV